MAPDTPHLLMSVSKSVVSTVAGILVSQGRLDVSAPVEKVVPELAGTSFQGATVQHLLDMRAGTRFDESYDNPESDVRTYERVYLWRPDGAEPRPADALEYYATLHNDGEHGGPFRYRSILTDVLGWVLEKAGGARLHELIEQSGLAAHGRRVRCRDHRRCPRQRHGRRRRLHHAARPGQVRTALRRWRARERQHGRQHDRPCPVRASAQHRADWLDTRHDRWRTGRAGGLRRSR